MKNHSSFFFGYTTVYPPNHIVNKSHYHNNLCGNKCRSHIILFAMKNRILPSECIHTLYLQYLALANYPLECTT